MEQPEKSSRSHSSSGVQESPGQSVESRQVRRARLRREALTALNRFQFLNVSPSDPTIRQRKIRRALAAEVTHEAFRRGERSIRQLLVEGTE